MNETLQVLPILGQCGRDIPGDQYVVMKERHGGSRKQRRGEMDAVCYRRQLRGWERRRSQVDFEGGVAISRRQRLIPIRDISAYRTYVSTRAQQIGENGAANDA